MGKTTLEMQAEYEDAIARKFEAKTRAIESVSRAFERAIEKGESQNMPSITNNFANAIIEVYKLYE